jgi:hypothetical protein
MAAVLMGVEHNQTARVGGQARNEGDDHHRK